MSQTTQKKDSHQGSIKNTLALLISLGLCLPMFISSSVILYKNYSEQVENYKQDLNRISEVSALGALEPLWNLDPESILPLLEAIQKDNRIVKLEIYQPDKQLFAKINREKVDTNDHETIDKIEKVTKKGEIIGEIHLSLSIQQLNNDIYDKITEIVVSTLFQLFVCLGLLIWLLNSKLVSKIKRLESEAGKLAQKNLSKPFIWKDNNEIGNLGRSLESTRISLKGLFENLERAVEERTETINIILNNVQSGFFLVDPNLQIAPGFTKSCIEITFGTIQEGIPMSQVLELDERAENHLNASLMQIFDDLMPEVASLSQIPSIIPFKDRYLSLVGRTIRDQENKVKQVLFTLNDVSSLMEAEQQNTLHKAIIRILGHRDAFISFVQEFRSLIEDCRENPDNRTQILANLHTMKGNAYIFGIDTLAMEIHRLEEKHTVTFQDFDRIEQHLVDFLVQNNNVLGITYFAKKPKFQQVSSKMLQELSTILESTPPNQLKQVIQHWLERIHLKSAKSIFSSLPFMVERLSEKISKPTKFKINGERIMIDPKIVQDLVNVFPHILRNSIDHGIEKR